MPYTVMPGRIFRSLLLRAFTPSVKKIFALDAGANRERSARRTSTGASVGSALIRTLSAGLAEAFTPAQRGPWAAAYTHCSPT